MIKNIYAVFKREINRIWDDSDLKVMILLAPLFYSMLYSSMYMFKTEEKLPVAVIDMDRSNSSHELLKDLNSHQMINIKEYLSSFENAEKQLKTEKCEGLIYIPEKFEADLKSGKGAGIKLYLNTQRFLHSNDLNKAVNEVILEEAGKFRSKLFLSKGYAPDAAKESSDPLVSNIQMLFNPSETYGDFLIPAILLLIIQQTLFMAIGQSSAKENESGTSSELYNISGRNVFNLITGKILIYILVFTSYLLFFYSFNTHLFSVEFYGSRAAFLISGIAGVVCVSLMGILTGSFFSKKINALVVISLSTYPLFFLSGYSWPLFAMPWYIKILSYLIPTTPLLAIVNRTLQMGGSWGNITGPFLHLAALTVFYWIAASIRVKQQEKRKTAVLN